MWQTYRQPSDLLSFQPFAKMFRNRRNNKISWKVIISRDFVGSLFLHTFEFGKCWLITGKLTKFFEYFKGFCRFTVSRHFWIRKMSRNRRIDQILWILQGILSFYSFWTLLNTESVQKQEIWPNSLNTSRDFVVLLFPDTFEFGKYL